MNGRRELPRLQHFWGKGAETGSEHSPPRVKQTRGAPADFLVSESPRYVGRAVVALAADPKVKKKSGRVFSSLSRVPGHWPASTDLPTSTAPGRTGATMPGRGTESTKSAMKDHIPTGFPTL